MSRCLMVAWLLCAWVLWENTILGNVNIWLVRDARTELADCSTVLRGLRDSEAQSRQKDGEKVETHARGLTVHRNDGRKEISLLMCLPSATDPRPRIKE